MKHDNKSESEKLRQKAEGLLNLSTSHSVSMKTPSSLSESEMLKIIHESEIYKIELELQNEELQQAKAAADIATSKYSDLYDFSPSGYLTLSKLSNIIELNLTGSIMLAKERSKLKNSKFSFFVSTDSRSIFTQFLDKVFLNERPETCEVTLIKDDNISTHVLLTGIITENEDLCNVTMVDITERRRLEHQIQTHLRMDSIGTLVGGISHDFNNILTALAGNIELLSMDNENLSEKQKRYLKNATQSTHRAVELTKQFQTLSTSSPDNGKAIDIHDIAGEVFGLISETTNRLIRKEIKFNKGEFFVYANSGELHQVLLNLATNSINAIEGREVTNNDFIRITAENHQVIAGDITGLTEGDYVHLSFKDTGSGMSDDVLNKAFEPMFTTKDKGSIRGQGLGLAMVYNIITRHHHGSIEIGSKEGKGTTFHIYLRKAHSEIIMVSQKSVANKSSSETILVVDDDELVANMVEGMLINIGYKVVIANDGIDALEIYTQNMDLVSAVILDLNMPNMSGKEVFQELLKLSPEVKVIISSGYGLEHSQQGVLAEAKGSLSKPYKLEDLYKLVRNVLDS